MWVATAWVDYEEGGTLAYRELLAGLFGRGGRRPTFTIISIWVDSSASLSGGRRLWGIPKERARFEFQYEPHFVAGAWDRGREIARGEFVPRTRLPGGWRIPGTVAQVLESRPSLTHADLRGRLQLGHGRLLVPGDSPLSYLRDRAPTLGFALREFRLVFGR